MPSELTTTARTYITGGGHSGTLAARGRGNKSMPFSQQKSGVFNSGARCIEAVKSV